MNWQQTNLEPVPSYLHAGGTIIRKGNYGVQHIYISEDRK